MAVVQMREAAKKHGHGLWVGAHEWGESLPSEAEAKFVVQRTAKGLWRAAVRGYNNGEFFDAIVSKDGQMAARIEGRHYQAMDSLQRLATVDDETMQRYEEAVKARESEKSGLLIHVLEGQKPGLWSVTGPAEYNSYEEYAQLLYSDPSQVGLAWGEWRDDQSGYHVKEPVAAKVVSEGPEFHVRPYNEGVRGIGASSIADRVRYYPTGANLVRDLTPDDETNLFYMNDSFAFGSPSPAPAQGNPLETIYGQ